MVAGAAAGVDHETGDGVAGQAAVAEAAGGVVDVASADTDTGEDVGGGGGGDDAVQAGVAAGAGGSGAGCWCWWRRLRRSW